MVKLLLIILSLLICAFPRYFTIKNRKFYDPQGGEVIFHGINIVWKVHPYEPPLDDTDIKAIKQMGLNAIRFDINWAGLQTANGVFNETYLKNSVDMVNWFGKNGFFVLLEYHQDLFGERFCGNGGPAWVTPEEVYGDFPKPTDNYTFLYGADGRMTNPEYCGVGEWARFYKTYGVNRAFKALYSNQYGIRDSFKAHWRKVAEALKDNPYIIAYEIINEPWPGNMYKNPLIMIPGLSQVFNLQGFHDEIAREIRQVDPDQNIGFQPVTWLNAIPAGYSHAPGGKQYADRSILCFHYYSPPTYGREIYMTARKLDMRRLGVGGLLTEFMAVPGTPGDPQDFFPDILNKCDKHHIGWFAWLYHKLLNKDMLTRVYAQRVGGTLVEHSYDPNTCKYVLYYQSNMNAGETLIFFPKQYFPHGFIMTTDPKVKFQIRDSRLIAIDSKNVGNRLVTVKIEKAGPETTGEKVWYPEEEKTEEKKEGKMEEKGSPRRERMMKQEDIMQVRPRSRSGQKEKQRQKSPTKERSKSPSPQKKQEKKQQL